MSYESDDISYKESHRLSQYPAEYRIKQDDNKGHYGIYEYRNGERYSYSGGGWTLQQAVQRLMEKTS